MSSKRKASQLAKKAAKKRKTALKKKPIEPTNESGPPQTAKVEPVKATEEPVKPEPKSEPKAEPKPEPVKEPVKSEEEEEEESEEEETAPPVNGKTKEATAEKSSSESEEEEGDEGDEEEEEDEDEETEPAPKNVPQKETKQKGTPTKNEAAEEQTSRVFVSNLNYDIEEENLKEALQEYGTIVNVEWISKPDFRGSGIVEFETVEQAQKALEAEGKEVLGRPLRIRIWRASPPSRRIEGGRRGGRDGGRDGRRGRGRGRVQGTGRALRNPTPKSPGGTTVFLGNLPFSVTEEQVKEHFDDCGEIEAVRWLERDGKFSGCGFLQFKQTDATDKAVEKNGTSLGGRQIRVDFAISND